MMGNKRFGRGFSVWTMVIMLLIVVLGVAVAVVSAEDTAMGNHLERRSPVLGEKRKASDSLRTEKTTKKLRMKTSKNKQSTSDLDTKTTTLKNGLQRDQTKKNQKLAAGTNQTPDVEDAETEVTSDSLSGKRKNSANTKTKSSKNPTKKVSASSTTTTTETPLFSGIQCLEPEKLEPTSVKSVKLFSPSARVKATGWTVSPAEISKYCQDKITAIASTTDPEAEELGPEGIEAALNGVMSCSGEDIMNAALEKKAKKGEAKKVGVRGAKSKKGGAKSKKGDAATSGGQLEVVFPAIPEIGRTKKLQQHLVKMCAAAILAGVKKCPNGGSVQLSGHELEFKPAAMSCSIGGDGSGPATAGPAKTSNTVTAQVQSGGKSTLKKKKGDDRR